MSFTDTVRFELIRRLGTGAMGTVYLARDRQLGNLVALKVLNVLDGMDLYRFKSEFRSLADIKHPNLAKLYELICEGPHWFFTMEYVGGVPFDVYVTGEGPNPRLDPERLRAAMQQLCTGVYAMHAAGCIHRDLKPSNVLCTPEGRVVILDFGLAKQTGSQSLKGEGLSGTPAYMAPEQAKDRPCLPAADWYAVGAMLYQVLAGRLPFEGALIELLLKKQMDTPPSPTTINPQADSAWSELAMRMLERDPGARPSGTEILTWLGLKDEPQPVLLDKAPQAAPNLFLGRDTELQMLHNSYGRARHGALAITLVEGPSGIGKTCLVDHFLDQITSHSEAPLVLRGRCHERETLPFKAFDGIVDALSHRIASLPIPEQARVLPAKVLYLAEVFPVLRRLEILDHARFAVPALTDPTELRNQAFAAFAEMLANVAALAPVVAFIDDLQWADRDSFALLRALVQGTRSPRLLLLATCRPWDEAKGDVVAAAWREFADQPGVHTVHLTPLPPEIVTALLEGLVDFTDVQTTHRRRLVTTAATEAAGNPFFTLELARHLRRTVKSGAQLTDDVVGQDLRLENLILDRLHELPEESQRMLQVAAVAGDPLPHKALAGAADVELGSEAWERGISALVEGRLIRRVGRQGSDVVEVYHDRIADAVLSSLDETGLRRVHEQIARAIEQWDRERTDMLARHWLVAADHERAKHYAREAAAEARTKLAFDRAAQLYETAVGLESTPDGKRELLRALGDCRAASGLARLAAEAYERAAALSEPAQATRLRHLAAEQLLRGGQIARGLEVIDGVLAQSGLRLAPSPRRALLAVTWRLVWLRLHGLKFEERPPSSISPEDRRLLDVLWSVNIGLSVVDTLRADDFLLRFVMLAMKVGDSRRVAQGLGIVAGQLAALGKSKFPWARRVADEADVLARRTDDHATIGLARLGKAIVRYFSGDFSASADELIAVEQYFLTHCHGVAWELATLRSFACYSLRLSGRMRELSERFDRYTADADRTGDRYMAANLRTYQCVVWLLRDDPERARKDIDGILDSWPDDLYQVQHFFHLYSRCEQALYMGRPEEAEAAIAAEKKRLKESGMLKVNGLYIEYLWLTGRVALAMAETRPANDRGRLLRLVRSNAHRLEDNDHQTATAMGNLMAAAAAWLGRADERARAVPMLERAVATAEAAGALLLAEAGRRWLGRILGTTAGNELFVRSERWMIDQGVRNAERLSALVVPGFRTQGEAN